MLRTLLRMIEAVLWDQQQLRPRRPRTAPPANLEAVRQPARSAAEVLASIDTMPVARVLHVSDGDTLIVAIGQIEAIVRLDSIDCPEDSQPWGDTARFGLTKIVGGRNVVLEVHGRDPLGRTLATIYVRHATESEWINVNERMVMLGHAWVMRLYYDHLPKDRQAEFNRLETRAKSKKVGLWNTDSPLPPWQWRKRKKSG